MWDFVQYIIVHTDRYEFKSTPADIQTFKIQINLLFLFLNLIQLSKCLLIGLHLVESIRAQINILFLLQHNHDFHWRLSGLFVLAWTFTDRRLLLFLTFPLRYLLLLGRVHFIHHLVIQKYHAQPCNSQAEYRSKYDLIEHKRDKQRQQTIPTNQPIRLIK